MEYSFLLIIGSLGFPVLMEVSQWLRHRGKMPFRFSLFTKITTVTFFILIVIGAIFIYLFEFSHFYSEKTWHQSFVHSLFYSISSRTGDQRRQPIFSTGHFVIEYFYVHRGIPQHCCDAAYHLQLCEREQNNKSIQKGDR